MRCGIDSSHEPAMQKEQTEMKSKMVRLGLTALAMTTVLVGRVARADTCTQGCNQQNKACISVARLAQLSCKQDCRTNSAPSDLGACVQSCMEAFRTAKTTCNSDHSTCIDACNPAPPPPDDSANAASCRGA